MNAWSVLAGLLVTVGASVGAVFQAVPDAPVKVGVEPTQQSSGDAGPDTNSTAPPESSDSNSTAPPANETEEPEGNATASEEPAEASGNNSCACILIEDWNDGLGPASATWSFPVAASNSALRFHFDAGAILGMGGSVSIVLRDGDGAVVAALERSGLELLGGYDVLEGTVLEPDAGTWSLTVEANDLVVSYAVTVETVC